MNEIRRPIRESEEMAAIRAIVQRHQMPGFVVDSRLELGEFNDNPAVWVTFVLQDDLSPGHPDLETWIKAIDRTIDAVRDDLLEQYPTRYPLFRIATA